MAFWRFGFGAQSSIDTLLGGSTSLSPQFSGLSLDTDHAAGGNSGMTPSPSPVVGVHTGAKSAAPPVSLDRLLEEEDLLQEFKGGHAKLTEFMSNPNIIRRMLEYISGEAFDPMQDEVTWPQSPSEEQSTLEHKIKYPHVCAEMILCDNHAVMTVLFADVEAFILPFWKAVLDKSPKETAQQNVQMAHWSRVNCFFLNRRPVEMLALLKSQPAFVRKLVRHLQSPPIADFLFRIVQSEELPEGQGILTWLAGQDLVPLLTAKLSPTLPPATHLAASDFVRSIITFCANANTQASNAEFSSPPPGMANSQSSDQLQQQGEPHTKWGMQQQQQQQQQGPMQDTKPPTWVSNILLQQIASRQVCSQLLSFALDDEGVEAAAPVEEVSLEDEEGDDKDKAQKADNPTPSQSTATPFVPQPIAFPTELPSPDEAQTPTSASIISSLTNVLSIYIDLIRKNNSDFTEQQLFQFMRRHSKPDGGEPPRLPPGPTVVDLSAALDLMRQSLPGFHRVLKHPRAAAHIDTAVGRLAPFTAERLKILELLAELLHCSHMALFNRSSSPSNPEYDEAGMLKGGYASLGALEKALTAAAGENMLREGSKMTLSSSTESFGTPLAKNESEAAEAADAEQISAAISSLSNGHATNGPSEEDKAEGSAEKGPEAQAEAEAAPVPSSSSPTAAAAAAAASTESADGTEVKTEDHTGSAGGKLRVAFLEEKLMSTALDLFFQHPWHNFLHSVVYDLVQQVINSNAEDEVNRKICVSLFEEGHLTKRILEAQKTNDEEAAHNKRRRLGYMGHISLLAEEVVKLFVNAPEVYEQVRTSVDRPAWAAYVDITLRETREADLQPLGGGISSALNDTISSSSGLSDEDDEFPGRKRFGDLSGQQQQQQQQKSPQKASPGNKFSQYFAQQLSGEPTSASTSDSDDEDVWPQSKTSFAAQSGQSPGPVSHFDDDFGEFEGGTNATSSSSDAFMAPRPNLTSADWNSEFRSSFSEEPSSPLENPFAGGDSDEEDDDGGDLEFGDFQDTPQITVPSFDSDSSFDFAPSSSSSSVAAAAGGSFDAAGHAADGSSVFGQLRTDSPEHSRVQLRSDGLVEGHTSDGETVVVPPDEMELKKEEGRRRSSSSSSSGSSTSTKSITRERSGSGSVQ